jgi:hypothetical protein
MLLAFFANTLSKHRCHKGGLADYALSGVDMEFPVYFLRHGGYFVESDGVHSWSISSDKIFIINYNLHSSNNSSLLHLIFLTYKILTSF